MRRESTSGGGAPALSSASNEKKVGATPGTGLLSTKAATGLNSNKNNPGNGSGTFTVAAHRGSNSKMQRRMTMPSPAEDLNALARDAALNKKQKMPDFLKNML